jgi:transposase-like protein
MECKTCDKACVKCGFNKSIQRWFCKDCKLYSQEIYAYRICTVADEKIIISLNKEGVGISGISRITGMSKSNVINRIKLLAPLVADLQSVTRSFNDKCMDKICTLDHRRLESFRLSGVKEVPIKWADPTGHMSKMTQLLEEPQLN